MRVSVVIILSDFDRERMLSISSGLFAATKGVLIPGGFCIFSGYECQLLDAVVNRISTLTLVIAEFG